MAFELPTLPFPRDSLNTPYIASPDVSGKYTVASGQWFKNASNLWTPVSATDPLPTIDNEVKTLLTAIQGYVDGIKTALGEVQASPTAYTILARLKDLADRLGEVSSSPTANTVLARLKTLEGYLDGVEAALGTQSDVEATGNGSLIAILKRIRTLVGQGIVTLGSAIGTTGVLVAGSDGTNARAIKTASDGTVFTQLTGSTVQDAQALPMTQAQKDIVARAIDNIIDTIGAENIKLFLPMWETEGNKAYDLLNRNLTFSLKPDAATGPTKGVSGPFGRCMGFDGLNDYLQEDPITEATAGTAEYNLINGTYKLAQRMVALACNPGFVRLKLKRTGTLSSATLKASIYTNNAGVPGTLVSNGESVTLACSSIGTTYQDRGFVFTTPPSLQKDQQYWLVLAYANATGVDASNYISWQYETGANTYGEARAVYDGSTWTVTNGENHVFGLWGNALSLSNDFTFIVVAKATLSTPGDKYIYSTSLMVNGYRPQLRYNADGTVITRHEDGSIITATLYDYPMNNFMVWASSFTKSLATQKSKLYRNGVLVATADGSAETAHVPKAHPFVIGGAMGAEGLLLANQYFVGSIGPVIYASKALTDAQIGKVTNYLLALRKYGLGV